MSRSDVRLVKSVTGLCPKSAQRTGHLPPLDFRRCWRRSLKVLLCLLILSLAVNLQPPSMCVFVSGVRVIKARPNIDLSAELSQINAY